MNSKNSLIIFLHIPKTGGSTVWNHLKNQFGNAAISPTHIGEKPNDEVSLIYGHDTYYGIHQKFQKKAPLYFTFLREPANRMVSGYNWDISLHNYDTDEFPFDQYIQWKANYMTKFLSMYMYNGTLRTIEASKLLSKWYSRINRLASYLGITSMISRSDMSHFKRAKEVLDKCSFVGTTETLDEDFDLLLGILDLDTNYESVNVTGDISIKANNENGFIAQKKIELTQELNELVLKYNKLDYKLYDYAKELRNKRLEEFKVS